VYNLLQGFATNSKALDARINRLVGLDKDRRKCKF
jgi:hypothetical protein